MVHNNDNISTNKVKVLYKMVQKLTCLVVQEKATDNMVILAVDLFFGVKPPEGCSHQGSLLERVDCIHRRSMGQVESHQLWDTESGCCV